MQAFCIESMDRVFTQWIALVHHCTALHTFAVLRHIIVFGVVLYQPTQDLFQIAALFLSKDFPFDNG